MRTRWLAAGAAVLAAGAMTLSGNALAQDDGAGDLPIDPQWLVNTLSRATSINEVKNNTPPEVIARRDKAVADWNAAKAAG